MAQRLCGAVLLLCCFNVVAQHSGKPTSSQALEENSKRYGVKVTASGLQYEVLKSGPADGDHPTPSSPCVVHYSGTLLDGKEFDSSYKRGKPASFTPSGVVKGWTEALQLMRAGDKWKIWLPSSLGYGASGSGSTIPPNSVLVFELELIEVKPAPEGIFWVIDLAMGNPMQVILFIYMLFQVRQYFAGGSAPAGTKELPLSEAAGCAENSKVFLSIQIGDAEPETVELELFTKSFPKTTENFRALCTGEKGKGKSGKTLTLKGSDFHRIIPSFMCQGGDFTAGNGTGGESIYGSKFPDEWEGGFVGHSKAGLLSMANAGKDTNGSQFFITLASCSHLNGKHVIFGQVLDGMDVVKKMEREGTGGGSPKQKVTIVDCGETKSKST
eukprot:CAMPEP_0115079234 /NCGR_PEP_ID=MMETSP0227-20121206/17990_1 /TAXON_ID=89957 /ORGANISM="Polarella glacialis, Strain CCMP 1383" /LENGTH=383 /DNA_ID=CAMNT_0002466705 /DNA_START=74 /DNA_END=1225 /DNA_ORIENTATION=+